MPQKVELLRVSMYGSRRINAVLVIVDRHEELAWFSELIFGKVAIFSLVVALLHRGVLITFFADAGFSGGFAFPCANARIPSVHRDLRFSAVARAPLCGKAGNIGRPSPGAHGFDFPFHFLTLGKSKLWVFAAVDI